MRCGAATVNITPDWPVELCGYVARVQPSNGVRDSIYARALFVEGGRGRLLWLHADVIGFGRSWVKAFAISRGTGARLRMRPPIIWRTPRFLCGRTGWAIA